MYPIHFVPRKFYILSSELLASTDCFLLDTHVNNYI